MDDLWIAFNVVCRLGVVAIVIVKLTRYYPLYTRPERIGLGIVGGCTLMTVAVLFQGDASPFRDWSTALFALGVLIYFGGRLKRQMAHDRANREQIRMAQERKPSR